MTSKKDNTPEEIRSCMKNPEDPWGKAARDNRATQLNPTHSESKKGNK